MGAIARRFCSIFLIQAAIHQVLSQQPPISQYVLSNYGPSNGQQHGLIPTAPTSSRSNIPLSTLPKLEGSAPVSQNHMPHCKMPLESKVSSGPLNSNVLNNLAIALQLLIVSNIMNLPAGEPIIPELSKLSSKYELSPLLEKYESVPLTTASILEQALSNPLYTYEAQSVPKSAMYTYEAQSVPKSAMYSYEAQSVPKSALYSYEAQSVPKSALYSYEAQSVPKSALYPYEAQSLRNANFLGSSGFAEPVFGPSVGTVRPNPRSSMTLMSPYDALGTSSFPDPLTTFPSSYSKKDFQSPYASILAQDGARDMFSMSDLF